MPDPSSSRESSEPSPGTSPAIRLATRDDIPALQALIDASMRALSVGFLSEAQVLAELAFVISPDTAMIDDGTLYVAVAPDGTLAGMGGWSRRRALQGGDAFKHAHAADMPDAPIDARSEPARIRQMFTHPAWARRGIARRLFEMARADAAREGFSAIILTATLAGIPLYEALGFRIDRRYVDRLPNGVEVPVAEMSRAVYLTE
jgi:GNAT superfamily N-acetyltransferase